MIRTLLANGVVLAALAATAACGGGDSSGQQQADNGIVVQLASPSARATPVPRKTASPTPSPSPTPLQVCGPNPDPALPKLLQVEQPQPQAKVKMPIEVRGWGSNIGLNNVGVALAVVDAKQTVLQVLNLPPQPRTYRVAPGGLEITDNTRPFAADVVLQNITEPTPVCLWVYQETDAQGNPKGVVQVPVVVTP